MSLSSQYLSLLQNGQSQIESLELEFNANLVNVVVLKTARWLPQISLPQLPIILVVGEDRIESIDPFCTQGNNDTDNLVLVKYFMNVVTIAAGEQDNIANIDIWLNWREQERRLFQWGMAAQFPNCFKSEFIGDPPILKEAFLKNYDVSGFGFRLWNIEYQSKSGVPT